MASSSSPVPFSTPSYTHDVFLSFRGQDTRSGFTGLLYQTLVKEGINTFIDNDLTRGEDIKKELLQVIEGSRISIVVFSANYASSKWCLDELFKIFQCKESKQQIVYPIFYKVDPSEIRNQKGQVGEDIAGLSKYKDYLEKMENWKEVLTKASTLSGRHIKDGEHEADVIREIVKWISTKIRKHTLLDVAPFLVGIESRVEDMLKLLHVGPGEEDTHMIGIWGSGGMGKTTLAKAVYNSISHNFEHCCFLANVRGESLSPGGLLQLQNNFLSKIIHRDQPKVTSVDEGITELKKNLRQKRVLLVLDDVDDLDQLRKLAGGCDWFDPRSRVIITTRDKNPLKAHNVNLIYEVKELNDQEALELFNFNAFKGKKNMEDLSELVTNVLQYVKGIPLALEVLGSDLCSKDTEAREVALEYYKKYPMQEVQQTLQRSYEALDNRMREIFLHIACFFKGHDKSHVMDILESCDLDPLYGLTVLQEKALIKVETNNSIWMHDLIEDMGKEIVRQESLNDAGKRSRLWIYEDVRDVLEENKGTDQIKGIVLKNLSWTFERIQLNSGSFTNMTNLQIFSVGYNCIRGVSMDYLPNQLRYLDWKNCQLRSLPTSFNPRKMGMLHISGPCGTQFVKERILKIMPFLISINLWDCDGLTRIPDLSILTFLKDLVISRCDDLVEVDPSVGRLHKLVNLKIHFCKKLERFPEKINLKSLETLFLIGCRRLEFFPEIEGDMMSLKSLDLRSTAIKELPCSVGNLTGLKDLAISHCHDLVEVDPSVGRLHKLVNLKIKWCRKLKGFPNKINLKSLETLVLSYCKRLDFFPEIEGDMMSLKSLDLSRTAIKELPCLVGNLTGLKSLSLNTCYYLTDVPSSIFYELQSLEKLDLSRCSSLVTFPTKSETLAPPISSTTRTRLKVDLSDCHKLEEVSEFPLEIHELHVTDCRSLERISKLSEILEGKDSKMFGELYLTGCKRLCSNLGARGLVFSAVVEADEMMGVADKEELTDLWALFLSCPKWEEFQVELPIMIPIPKWFTYRQEVYLDVNRDDDETPDEVIKTEHEFCIEIPQNCKGLALCMQSQYHWTRKVVYSYSINGNEFGTCCIEGDIGRVHYIPLVTVKRKLSECGMPPANDMFRVKFIHLSKYYIRSYGVHLIEDSEGDGRQVTNMSSQPPSISTVYKRGTDQIKDIVLRDQFSSENKDELECYTKHPIQDLEEISERIQVTSFLKTTNIGARRVSTINELLKKMATELFQQKPANKLPRLHPTVRIAKAIIKKWSEPNGIPFNATELAEIPFLFMSAICHLGHIDLLRSDISRPVEGFKIFIILTSLNFESCQFLK